MLLTNTQTDGKETITFAVGAGNYHQWANYVYMLYSECIGCTYFQQRCQHDNECVITTAMRLQKFHKYVGHDPQEIRFNEIVDKKQSFFSEVTISYEENMRTCLRALAAR